MKTTCVVGGAGFVGSHLVDLLVERGAEKIVVVDNFFLGNMENLSWAMDHGNVVIYKEDARYLSAMQNIVEREKPDVVFNLAVKPLPYSFVDPEGAYMTSVEITQNLAQILRRKKYCRLVHFSSSEAYGNAVQVPMCENHPLNPTSPYGAGKAAADLLLLSYHRLFELPVSILRPFNMYGPRQNTGSYAAVVPVTIRRILNGEKPIIEGDGYQSRDFSYVRDVADAGLKLYKCDKAVGRVVNVGSGKETSIKKIIRLICEALDYPFSEVEYKPPRPADVRRHLADISLAESLFGYKPQTSLKEGLAITIDSLKNSV